MAQVKLLQSQPFGLIEPRPQNIYLGVFVSVFLQRDRQFVSQCLCLASERGFALLEICDLVLLLIQFLGLDSILVTQVLHLGSCVACLIKVLLVLVLEKVFIVIFLAR